MATNEQIDAGQAVYNPMTLAAYDWGVLGFSNHFLWLCPTRHLRAMYDANLSGNHLDIGVGTGYFLKAARWPGYAPDITLMDLNPHSLNAAAKRIAHLKPKIIEGDIFKPIPTDRKFDSIGLCYQLHCLPGAMNEKAPVIFQNIANAANPGARIFGATILQDDDHPRSIPAQKLMNFYNSKGIFCNEKDTENDLTTALHAAFDQVKISRHGHVALFEAVVR